ncbi:hypothetical protein FRX31_009549 [Thalictrum thalictroides]|uniref:Uncharacterized protein n=1 Tax=Thalictrum thalictroides TaxID=46969 RepID=A0A7J6WU06_THATH|nr:hypothetical protein FRX31_009549 [Thalictrum thalictroides]
MGLIATTSILRVREDATDVFQRYLHLRERMLVLAAYFIVNNDRIKKRISTGSSHKLYVEI